MNIILIFLFFTGCNTFATIGANNSNDAESDSPETGRDTGLLVADAADVSVVEDAADTADAADVTTGDVFDMAADIDSGLQPFDESMFDDWFVTVIPSAAGEDFNRLSMTTSFSANTPIYFAFLAKDPDPTLDNARVFSLSRPSDYGVRNLTTDLLSTAIPSQMDVPALNDIDLYMNSAILGAAIGFNRVNDRIGERHDNYIAGTQLTTIPDGAEEASMLIGRNGQTLATKSAVPQTLIWATATAGSAQAFSTSDTVALPTLFHVPVSDGDASLLTTDGPISAIYYRVDATNKNIWFFDPTTLSTDNVLFQPSWSQFDAKFIGNHGPAETPEYIFAANTGELEISVRTIDLAGTNNAEIAPIVTAPALNVSDIDVSHIDIATYFHPADDAPLNPANAVITTVETDRENAGRTFVAFRVVVVGDQSIELVACRRLMIGVRKYEIDSVVYTDGDALVVAASTIYSASNQTTAQQYGIDGMRFPGLFVRDAMLQTPYDTTCQDCNPFGNAVGNVPRCDGPN